MVLVELQTKHLSLQKSKCNCSYNLLLSFRKKKQNKLLTEIIAAIVTTSPAEQELLRVYFSNVLVFY